MACRPDMKLLGSNALIVEFLSIGTPGLWLCQQFNTLTHNLCLQKICLKLHTPGRSVTIVRNIICVLAYYLFCVCVYLNSSKSTYLELMLLYIRHKKQKY